MKLWIRSCRLSIVFACAALLSLSGPDSRAWSQQETSGWKDRWDRTLAGAKKEGRVVVFGPAGQQMRESVTQGFRKAFPDINIEYNGGREGDFATKILAERNGGVYNADVVISGPSLSHLYLKPNKALDPIDQALILPEVTEVKRWRDQQLHFADKEGRYNLVFVGYTRPVLAHNPKSVRAEEIDEPQKLLDAKWKGRIVISDPLPPGGGYTFFHWLWTMMGPEKATDYFRRLRAQAGVIDRNERRQLEWVAQGRYDIVIGPGTSQLQQLLNAGVEIGVLTEFKALHTWLTAGGGSLMLINRAPHPNAAAVFINWILGRDGQTAYSRAINVSSRRLDTPTDHIPPYMIPKPGVKYWQSYLEGISNRSEDEEKLIKELFGK
jgi:iron(III) transport system substrate-binding protein